MHTESLANQTIWLTGSRRIGQQVARALAAEGAAMPIRAISTSRLHVLGLGASNNCSVIKEERDELRGPAVETPRRPYTSDR
jgi:hypothetical protein